MLLSLPKSSKSQLIMVGGLSIVVNIGLAYMLYLVITPSHSATALNNIPAYTVRTVQPKEKPKPKKVELIVAANAPNSAPAKPTIVNFSIPEMDSAVVLPDIVFSPDIELSINPTFEFDVRAIGTKNGSNIQSQVVFAKPTYQVPPKYPNKAKRNGIEGHVILELLVNEKGIPMQHRVIEEKPEGVFLRSSLRSVMRWKFVPPKTGQQWQQVTLNYSLEK